MIEQEDGFKNLHLASILDIDKLAFSPIKKGIRSNKRDIEDFCFNNQIRPPNPIHSFRSMSLIAVNPTGKNQKTARKLGNTPIEKPKAKQEFNQLISFKHRMKIPSPKSNYLQTKKTVRYQPLSRVHNFRELNYNLKEKKFNSSFEELKPLDRDLHLDRIDTEFRGRFHNGPDNPTHRIFLKKVHEFDIDKIAQPSPDITRPSLTERPGRFIGRNRKSTQTLLLEAKMKLIEEGKDEENRVYHDTFRKTTGFKILKNSKESMDVPGKVIQGGSLAASIKKSRLQIFIENKKQRKKRHTESMNKSIMIENPKETGEIQDKDKYEEYHRRTTALERKIENRESVKSHNTKKQNRKSQMYDFHFKYQTNHLPDDTSPQVNPKSSSPFSPIINKQRSSSETSFYLSIDTSPALKTTQPRFQDQASSSILNQLLSSCAAYTTREGETDWELKRADSRLRESIQEVKSTLTTHERLFKQDYIEEVIQEFHKQTKVFLPSKEMHLKCLKGTPNSNSKYN